MIVQALLDRTPAGGTVWLPAGELRVPSGTTWRVPRPMVVDGAGALIVVEGQTAAPLFDASALAGGTLAFRNMDVDAPTASGVSTQSAILWSRAKTPTGRLIVEDSTIHGAWNAAVQRSGGGAVEVRRCALEAWSSPVKVFESHLLGSGYTLTIEDSTLRPSAGSAPDSIGVYVHPHIETVVRRVHGSGFGRWVVYANGTMPGASRWTLDDVTADGCSLIQAPGGGAELLLRACRELGAQRNGGSLLRGKVVSVGSTWAGQNGHSFPPGHHDISYIGDTFTRQAQYAVTCGRTVGGTVRVIDSTFDLSATGRVLLTARDAAADLNVSMVRSSVTVADDHTRRSQITVLRQGVLHLVGTTIPTPDVAAPGEVVRWTF